MVNLFTCIGKGHGAPVVPASRDDWEKMRKDAELARMCDSIKKGDKDAKHRLPVWTPHCALFQNNHRSIADALKPLNRLMLDFDEKGHTSEIMCKMGIQNGVMETEVCQPLFPLMIEESVCGGTHVLVEMPEGMKPEEAQQLMKQITGFEPDKAVKDVSRCIYMVPEDHTRYLHPRFFEVSEACEGNLSQATDATYLQTLNSNSKTAMAINQAALTKKQPIMNNPLSTMNENQPAMTDDSVTDGSTELTFKDIPYAMIVAEWWRRNGGEPHKGERNVKLHKLAVNLRAICDNDKELLMQVMPHCSLSDNELRSIVESACKESPKGISKLMQNIVDALSLGIASDELADAEAVAEETGVTVNVRTLPIGLKESLVGVPVSMHLPVLCGVLPLAAAYADQVEVEYCDGNKHHLGLMSIIYGEQASNKSVVKNAVEIWKQPMDEEDAISRRREEEWKELKKSRKANEKAPDDPHVVIRGLPVTVSNSTLLRRLKNSSHHTLYSFCEELDTLRKTNGAGSWSAKYDVYRMSFDRGEWGQDYNSDQAESGVVKVAYNWTMLGTHGALKKCFKQDNIENGLSSRMLLAEMPDSSFSKMPKFGKRSASDEARIMQAVSRLRSYSGEVDVPRLRKTIGRWVEQKRVEAAKDIDRVKDIYRKRAAVIGFRCGVVFHLLSGCAKESKSCLEFAEMMAEYCLNQQMAVFGEGLRHQLVEARTECQRYSANHSVFDQLPVQFTMDDLRALKQGFCEEPGLRKIVSRWGRDNWVQKVDKCHWQKMPVQSL